VRKRIKKVSKESEGARSDQDPLMENRKNGE
jgi:hypothetical protein